MKEYALCGEVTKDALHNSNKVKSNVLFDINDILCNDRMNNKVIELFKVINCS